MWLKRFPGRPAPVTGREPTWQGFLLATTLLCGSAAASDLLPGDPAQGEKIHGQRCTSCHAQQFGGDGSGIYTRPDHKIRSIEGLIGQVEFCSKATGANLEPAAIDDVVHYLNANFYKLDVAK